MNDFSGRKRSRQQERVQKLCDQADANLFFNALTDDGMSDKLESLLLVCFPLCRLVGILDLSTGGVIDVAFGACEGIDSGEQGLLRQLFETRRSIAQ